MEKFTSLDSESLQADVFSSLITTSPDVLWIYDVKKDKGRWFKSAKNTGKFDLPSEENSIERWKNLIHKEDQEKAYSALMKVLKETSVVSFEQEYRITCNNEHYLLIDKTYIRRDTNGAAVQCINICYDQTDTHKEILPVTDGVTVNSTIRNELVISQQRLKEAENMLDELQFMLKTSQQIAKTGSWKYNLKTGKCFCTEEFYAIYGLSQDFNLSDPEFFLKVLYGTREGTEVLLSLKKLIKDGQSIDFVSQVTTPIGIQKYIRLVAYPMYAGEVISDIRGVAQDVTEFKQTENQWRLSEEKFHRVFKFTPDFMSLARESDGIIIEVNDKAQIVSGYSENEMVGKTAKELNLWVNPEDFKIFFEQYAKNFNATCEAQWRKKNGQFIYIMLSSVRVTLNGEYYRLSLVKDITARKEAEEKFSKAFSLSPDLMSIIREKDQVILDVNENATMLGFSREEVLGKTTKELNLWVSPEERDTYYQIYKSNPKISYEARWRRKNGEEIFVVINATRVELYNEPYILSSVRDVTARRQAEEKFQTVFRLNPDMIAIIRKKDSVIIDINDRVFNSIGYRRDEMIGKRYDSLDIWLAGDKRKPINLDANNPTTFHEDRIKNRNGDEVFVLVSGAIIDILGEPHFLYITKDITERKREEEEAKKNLAQLAEAEKKLGEARVTALRSAMNPHFIFNALNSIQFFISKNERQEAIQYLSTFSKLIRGILGGAAQNTIKLNDELDLLKHYINLELIRFEKKINVIFTVDPEINKGNIEIPALVVQPFVENAILHGLYDKRAEGNLKISVHKPTADFLLFVVEDDGIGRAAAGQIQTMKNLEHHKSLGVSLAEERLKIINADSHIAVETEDLFDSGIPAGTKVKIWLRIQ